MKLGPKEAARKFPARRQACYAGGLRGKAQLWTFGGRAAPLPARSWSWPQATCTSVLRIRLHPTASPTSPFGCTYFCTSADALCPTRQPSPHATKLLCIGSSAGPAPGTSRWDSACLSLNNHASSSAVYLVHRIGRCHAWLIQFSTFVLDPSSHVPVLDCGWRHTRRHLGWPHRRHSEEWSVLRSNLCLSELAQTREVFFS